MLVFTGVYVCVNAKLTFVSFFFLFIFLHLSLKREWGRDSSQESESFITQIVLLVFGFYCQCLIRLGEQSFKDADVLSEKINFSAPGGPKSTIFDTDDVDPLFFEVSIVSAPPDPPY